MLCYSTIRRAATLPASNLNYSRGWTGQQVGRIKNQQYLQVLTEFLPYQHLTMLNVSIVKESKDI
jgi:hypothetical protein